MGTAVENEMPIAFEMRLKFWRRIRSCTFGAFLRLARAENS
jgi:hypothetical protein